jgi:hypothetical protein
MKRRNCGKKVFGTNSLLRSANHFKKQATVSFYKNLDEVSCCA